MTTGQFTALDALDLDAGCEQLDQFKLGGIMGNAQGSKSTGP